MLVACPICCIMHENKENIEDMVKRGRSKVVGMKGEQNASSRLNEETVVKILNDQRPYSQISNEYGVSETHVGKIKRGEKWTHIYERFVLGGSL